MLQRLDNIGIFMGFVLPPSYLVRDGIDVHLNETQKVDIINDNMGLYAM